MTAGALLGAATPLPTAVAVFGDGGVIERNPSPVGGTWAWCAVTAAGQRVRQVSGYVLPEDHPHFGWVRVPGDTVSNNQTEFYALLNALEGMPSGWTGKVCSDSQNALGWWVRLFDWSGAGAYPVPAVPEGWQRRAKAVLARVHVERWVHVLGHPNATELAQHWKLDSAGRKRPVSSHQVWCDTECTRLRTLHSVLLHEPLGARSGAPATPATLAQAA